MPLPRLRAFFVFVVLAFCGSSPFRIFGADLRINEFLSANRGGLVDEDGEYEDWIEIQNGGATAINLAGHGLSDKPGQPFLWTFPSRIIEPGEFLLVRASEKNRTGAIQAGLLREIYSDITGAGMDDLLGAYSYPELPTERLLLTGGLETAADYADNYGQRIRGFITAPQTGAYVFWISGDDDCRLQLSADDDPLKVVTIASVTGYTSSRQFDKFPSQQSAPVNLVAGRRYAINVLHKDGVGGDHLAVRWRRPDNVIQTPIPDSVLSTDLGELHANFKISGTGDTLQLTAPDGTVLDVAPSIALPGNVSYGRLPGAPATWAYFAAPTPAAANTTTPAFSTLPRPEFSTAGGFHTGTVSLELATSDPAATILYTLDGSDPVPERLSGGTYTYKTQYPTNSGNAFGPLLTGAYQTRTYTAPLTITDRTAQANRLSLINTTYAQTAANYAPTTPVFKGTVVRARLVKGGALPGPIVTQTYFVTPQGAARYPLPVVSLALNDESLFGYERGIYVAGVDFDQWREGTTAGPSPPLPANYNRRGEANERPVHFELFVPGEGRVHAQNLGVRMNGGWSRAWEMKTLRFYANDAYDDADWLDYPLFPGLKGRGTGTPIGSYRRFLLRNSGNDFGAIMMRDAFVQAFFAPLGVDHQAYRPVAHFINGEFWGLINLRERVDRFFIQSHYGVNETDVVVLNNNAVVEEGLPSDRDEYLALREYIRTNDMTLPQHYAYAAERIDFDNLILYFVAQIYSANTDWPHNNIDYWRARTPNLSPAAPRGHDGRWRWVLFDADLSFANAAHDTLAAAVTPSDDWQRVLLGKLTKNTEFRNRFINAFADHLSNTFTATRASTLADSMRAVIAPLYPEHAARWRNSQTNPSVDFLKNFVINRGPQMRLLLANRYGLGATVNITVQNPNPAQGSVRLNTLTSSSAITGAYYPTIPVTVTALPAPGYVFSGWLNRPADTTATITVAPSAGLTLTPVFAAAPVPEIVHYWNFNNTAALLAPTSGLPGAGLVVSPGADTAVLSGTGQEFTAVNALNGDLASSHLRVNNPLGAELRLSLPTVGYGTPVVRYETRRSGQGAATQQIDYTLDGANYVAHSFVTVPDGVPLVVTLDFAAVAGASANPAFGVRVRFSGGTGIGASAGNNRFDNITVHAPRLPGVNLPPALAPSAPAFVACVAGGAAATLDLRTVFSDPEGGALAFTAAATRPGFATVTMVGPLVTLAGLSAGETALTLGASDGLNPAVQTTVRVLVHPAPHVLAGGEFTFGAWPATAPELTYPAHMLFLQGAEADSTSATALDQAYHIPAEDYAAADLALVGQPYAVTSRSRINGLGDDGIAFINTGRARDLGGALVALDTRAVASATVSWVAGTVTPNVRVYALTPQYRIGHSGAWTDLPGDAVVYQRSATAGDALALGPVALPAGLVGQPYVQLLWRYHLVSGTTGARAQLRLDDVRVRPWSAAFAGWSEQQFPDPADRADPAVSGPGADPRGVGAPNLLRYALGIPLGATPGPRLPVVERSTDPAGNGLAFSFPYDPTLPGIAYRVEASADLVDWSETVFDSRTSSVPEIVNGRISVTDAHPPDAPARRFLRLRVLQTP